MNAAENRGGTGATRPEQGGPALSNVERELDDKTKAWVLKRTGATKILDFYTVGVDASCTFGWRGRHKHFIVADLSQRYNYCEATGVIHVLQLTRMIRG